MTVDPLNLLYNSKLLCNRASAKIKLNQTKEALKDFDNAIQYIYNFILIFSIETILIMVKPIIGKQSV